jgi:ABC-type antimicrobial peptide transport system permease subunit
MNSFEDLCTDEVLVERIDGTISAPIKCSINGKTISIFDKTLDVSTADKLVRTLPNGKAERYDILDVEFIDQFGGIAASYDLKVRRHGSLITTPKATVNKISISNSHSFQVGDHNIQSVVNSFKYILKEIEDSNASPETKTEAKSRLKAFLEHPLTSAILGGAAGSLL